LRQEWSGLKDWISILHQQWIYIWLGSSYWWSPLGSCYMKKWVLLWWKTSLLVFRVVLFVSIWRMIQLGEHGIHRNSKWTLQGHPYLSELIYHLLLHQVPCLKECEPWGIDEIDCLINAAIFLNRALRCRVSHFYKLKINILGFILWSWKDVLITIFSPIVSLLSSWFNLPLIPIYFINIFVILFDNSLLFIEFL